MLKKIPLTVVVLWKSARKNFFFYQNFSTNQNFRKNKFQFFQFFSIGIPRPVDTDAKKIQLTSVVFSKSARKNFFFPGNFSIKQNSRKNQIQLFDFFLIGIEKSMNTDAKKILLTFVVLSKSARKILFL